MKLKAFTLIELLVAMAVSGIVVSSSYFCFSIVAKQFSAYRSSSDKTMDILLVKMLLENDMHVFPYARNKSAYELELSDVNESRIDYRFGSRFIVREQNSVTDTFHVRLGEIKMQFGKKAVTEPDDLVDEIIFGIELPDSSYTMRFTKEYAPDVLMAEEEQKSIKWQ